jgi:Xaa-Pro dipeptidase
VPYYSGYYPWNLRQIPERLHMPVWPKAGKPAFVVTDRRAEALQPADTYLTDIVAYSGEGLDSMRALAEVLRDRGVTKGTVGIEERAFPAGHLRELERRLSGVQFVDAFSFIESVRLIKTPAEVELITQITNWTTAAIDTAFAAVQPGDTERSVSSRMQYELLKSGADLITHPMFGAGERSGIYHGIATDKKIEAGMIIKTDFGGFVHGYHSDIARTAVVGKASDYQRDMHAKVTEIKHRIVDYIRPGMLASEVARFGRKSYADLGIECKWSLMGHSIGLGVHESPQIYDGVDEPILPGMVMMIEIGYQDFPNDSFHVEDMIVITDSRAEYRSDFSKHETLWEIGV